MQDRVEYNVILLLCLRTAFTLAQAFCNVKNDKNNVSCVFQGERDALKDELDRERHERIQQAQDLDTYFR